MIKKFVGLGLCAALAFSATGAFAATEFTDLDSGHWAYAVVNTLVDEGTIKGYEDGSFRPDSTVTRAEFVKMIGMGNDKRTQDYSDVPKEHWGYDYIMSSGLKGDDETHFAPDRAITRAETTELLWERAGAKTGVKAPEAIRNQAENKEAISWIYTYGVLIGDDGWDLRLGDTLSRAEAAALIIKSRNVDKPISFVNNVSKDLLQYMFETTKLFDGAYQPDKQITNGEMARASVRLATDEFDPTYSSYSVEESFEHPYAKDIYILCRTLGVDTVNAEFADKPATIADTLASLRSSMTRRTNISPSMELQLYENGEKALTEPITQKEFAAIILQYDEWGGTQMEITTEKDDVGQYVIHSLPVKKSGLPANAEKFQAVVAGIPNEVYEFPFNVSGTNDQIGNPKAIYNSIRMLANGFASTAEKMEKLAQDNYNIGLKISCYPNLTYNNGTGFSVRIKCEVTSGNTEVTPKTLFEESAITNVDTPLATGTVFYAEMVTPYMIFE